MHALFTTKIECVTRKLIILHENRKIFYVLYSIHMVTQYYNNNRILDSPQFEDLLPSHDSLYFSFNRLICGTTNQIHFSIRDNTIIEWIKSGTDRQTHSVVCGSWHVFDWFCDMATVAIATKPKTNLYYHSFAAWKKKIETSSDNPE